MSSESSQPSTSNEPPASSPDTPNPEASSGRLETSLDSNSHSKPSSTSQPLQESPARQLPEEKHDSENHDTPSDPQPPSQEEDVRSCWICLQDETEDPPNPSPWRAPCPCVLKAHEACLLDWIAENRTPAGGPQQGRSKKILCPQCKNEIRVSRATSPLVALASKGNRFMDRLWMPGLVGMVTGSFITTCMVHGAGSVYMIFGQERATEILGPISHPNPTFRNLLGLEVGFISRVLMPYGFFMSGDHWRLSIGLPMIPIALITSRIRQGTWLFLAFPILFLGTTEQFWQWTNQDEIWPLNPAAVFTFLPFVRSLYNQAYEELFGRMEESWNKALRPRGGEPDMQEAEDEAVDQGNNAVIEPEPRVDEFVMEIPIPNLNFFGGNDGGDNDDNSSTSSSHDGRRQLDAQHGAEAQIQEAQPDPQAALIDDDTNVIPALPPTTRASDDSFGPDPSDLQDSQAREDQASLAAAGALLGIDPTTGDDVDIPGLMDFEAADPLAPAIAAAAAAAALEEVQHLQQQQQQNEPELAPRPEGARGQGWAESALGTLDAAADKMLGALFFPGAAFATGEALRLALGTPSPTSILGKSGLMRERWGRSVLGGCVFVVAKDAWGLFVKWRMVQLHRGRRVEDWDFAKVEREKREKEERRRKRRERREAAAAAVLASRNGANARNDGPGRGQAPVPARQGWWRFRGLL